MLNRMLCLIAVLALAGCVTIPPEERAAACRTTDWQRYGENDGRLGVPTATRAERFADCAELGVPVDLAAYQSGRKDGLAIYCTAENGFEAGYRGFHYRNVCPPALEPDFLQGYERGRRERPAYLLYPRIAVGIGTGHIYSGYGYGYGYPFYRGRRCHRWYRYCW